MDKDNQKKIKSSKERRRSGRPPRRPVTKPKLMKAINLIGGVTKLSLELNISQGIISTWLYTNMKIPAHHVSKITIATKGKIKQEDLRPDIFIKIPDYKNTKPH